MFYYQLRESFQYCWLVYGWFSILISKGKGNLRITLNFAENYVNFSSVIFVNIADRLSSFFSRTWTWWVMVCRALLHPYFLILH